LDLNTRVEIAKESRQAVHTEFLRATPRLGLLFLVVQATAERVMGVVNLHDEVRDGELQLGAPPLAGRIARGKFQAIAEKQKDVRRLVRSTPACLQKGGSERRRSRSASSSHRCRAGTPPPSSSGLRATSTYAAAAASSARRTNSARPWMPGQVVELVDHLEFFDEATSSINPNRVLTGAQHDARGNDGNR